MVLDTMYCHAFLINSCYLYIFSDTNVYFVWFSGKKEDSKLDANQVIFFHLSKAELQLNAWKCIWSNCLGSIWLSKSSSPSPPHSSTFGSILFEPSNMPSLFLTHMGRPAQANSQVSEQTQWPQPSLYSSPGWACCFAVRYPHLSPARVTLQVSLAWSISVINCSMWSGNKSVQDLQWEIY